MKKKIVGMLLVLVLVAGFNAVVLGNTKCGGGGGGGGAIGEPVSAPLPPGFSVEG